MTDKESKLVEDENICANCIWNKKNKCTQPVGLCPQVILIKRYQEYSRNKGRCEAFDDVITKVGEKIEFSKKIYNKEGMGWVKTGRINAYNDVLDEVKALKKETEK